MADSPPAPSDGPIVGAASGTGRSHPGMPRWVKAAIAAVLVLTGVLVIGKVAGVEHGPGMHGGDDRPPASQVGEDAAGAEGHMPPPGVDHGQP